MAPQPICYRAQKNNVAPRQDSLNPEHVTISVIACLRNVPVAQQPADLERTDARRPSDEEIESECTAAEATATKSSTKEAYQRRYAF